MTEDVAGQMIAVRMYQTDRLIVVARRCRGSSPRTSPSPCAATTS
jgi:hypothetical protein